MRGSSPAPPDDMCNTRCISSRACPGTCGAAHTGLKTQRTVCTCAHVAHGGRGTKRLRCRWCAVDDHAPDRGKDQTPSGSTDACWWRHCGAPSTISRAQTWPSESGKQCRPHRTRRRSLPLPGALPATTTARRPAARQTRARRRTPGPSRYRSDTYWCRWGGGWCDRGRLSQGSRQRRLA